MANPCHYARFKGLRQMAKEHPIPADNRELDEIFTPLLQNSDNCTAGAASDRVYENKSIPSQSTFTKQSRPDSSGNSLSYDTRAPDLRPGWIYARQRSGCHLCNLRQCLPSSL